MKQTFTLIVLLLLSGLTFGKSIDEATAKQVGQSFLANKTTSTSFKSGVSLELAYTASSQVNSEVATVKPTNYFYVFNVSNADGFVIVAGDDQSTPILAYSDEVDFDANNIPINTQKWLESYKSEIRYIIKNNIGQTKELLNDWSELASGKVSTVFNKKAAVSPLVQTKWDQSPYYNALCPYDNAAGDRTVTGCVATAMAQIMKFWNYPAIGTGSHSYSHSSYGTLSANFSATSYAWSSMPNQIFSSNTAIATLMYHCGVSVDMNYDVAANGGSGAYVITSASPVTHCSEYALENYFGYKTTLEGIERNNYTESQWISMLKVELDAGRPILHAGFGSGGGHAFVCDGYDNNNFFHFNWGWGGQEDGYFTVNALNPGSLGTGGGSGGFNNNQQIIVGIEPSTSTPSQTMDMRLYAGITVNPDPIEYGGAFTVTTNFANYGTSAAQNFSGDLAAALFNANNEFVSYVEVKTGISLTYNSYFSNPIVFSSAGITALTPGTYTVGLYFKATGASQWTAFANGSYQNFKSIQVKGNDTNPLKLFAAIVTTPGTIVRNQTFTVNFDVANYGASTFDGEISVDIHSSDGTWIRELSNQSGLSLPPNTHFTNGLTYTISGGIDDEAGSYQFFVWDKPANGDWELLGSGTFANPITVQVVEPGLAADSYEPNNSQGAARNMPVTFSGNTAKVITTGSNLHVGTDNDYYKVVLAAGYSYTIQARIHDSYNSSNGQQYTVDGLVSYSTDGINWSDAFEDVIHDAITANGGTTVYFKVAPYFSGNTGTYLFDATLTRGASSSEKEIMAFTTNGAVGAAIINSANATVKLTVASSSDLTSLIPEISISNSATINPASGIPRNFTNPVVYTVTAQDASTKQWTVTITKLNTGVEDISLNESIEVYPNPAKDQLTIDIGKLDVKIMKASMFDIQGKEVFSQQENFNSTLQLNKLENGFYTLQLVTDKGTVTKKIIIQQ